MTTILKGSIFSILKLEKLQFHPTENKIVKNHVQICLRKQEFTIQPGKPPHLISISKNHDIIAKTKVHPFDENR